MLKQSYAAAVTMRRLLLFCSEIETFNHLIQIDVKALGVFAAVAVVYVMCVAFVMAVTAVIAVVTVDVVIVVYAAAVVAATKAA